MKIEKILTNISDDDIKDGVLIIPDGVTMLLDVDGYETNVWFPPDDELDGNSFSAKSIIIPNSVKTIDEGWFTGCKGLTDIKVDKNNASFCSLDGVLFSKDKTKLVYYPHGRNNASYTIPEGTTDIADSAFIICESLTDIVIPDSVCRIGTAAFFGCCSMKKITIPGSVKCIGQLAIMDKTIECHRGSVAEEYAKKYNNSCKIID